MKSVRSGWVLLFVAIVTIGQAAVPHSSQATPKQPEPTQLHAPAAPTPVVPYGAGDWTYLTGAQGIEPTFHEIGFPDAGWSHTGVAPFGSAGGCPVAAGVVTLWPVNNDLFCSGGP